MIRKFNLKLDRNQIFLIVSTLILTLGFFSNIWNASYQEEFPDWDSDSESLIIGRLGKSDRDGIFSGGGLTGRYQNPDVVDTVWYQYDIYINKLNVEDKYYLSYKSQSAGQAMTYTILDVITPFSKEGNLRFFELFTSVLSALAFSFFLLWCYRQFGLAASIITLVFLMLSNAPTLFGKNLWWVLWAYYIPFLAVLWALEHERTSGKPISNLRFSLLVFGAVMIKSFFNGFEYISTVLVMMVTPLFYYFIISKWSFVKLVVRSGLSFVSSVAATLVSFFILAIQISKVDGSLQAGFDHILDSYLRRSSGDPGLFDEVYRESLESSIPEVIGRYLFSTKAPAFDFNSLFGAPFGTTQYWMVDYAGIILVFGVFSILALLAPRINWSDKSNQTKNIALVLTLWASMAAPLSWFIIFKGHSYIHMTLNFITWYMPFMLFGFIVVGHTIMQLNKLYLKIAAGLLLVPLFFAGHTIDQSIRNVIEDYKIYRFVQNEGLELHSLTNGGVYYWEERFWKIQEGNEQEIELLMELPIDTSMTSVRDSVINHSIRLDQQDSVIQFPWWTGKNNLSIHYDEIVDKGVLKQLERIKEGEELDYTISPWNN